MSWLQHDTIHKDNNSIMIGSVPLRWHHNGCDGVSNHQPHDCLLNQLFRRSSKKTSKLRVTGLCVGNSPGTGEFPAQMTSNAENVSISWRHHALSVCRSHLVITIITIGPVILAYFSQNAGALHLFCFHFRQAWLLLILIGIWESGDHSGLWAQPMRHHVTLKCRLSLTEHIPGMIPAANSSSMRTGYGIFFIHILTNIHATFRSLLTRNDVCKTDIFYFIGSTVYCGNVTEITIWDGWLCMLMNYTHDDVIKWKHCPRYWPFVRGIHRSRWIPRTKASGAELWYFLWSAPE